MLARGTTEAALTDAADVIALATSQDDLQFLYPGLALAALAHRAADNPHQSRSVPSLP